MHARPLRGLAPPTPCIPVQHYPTARAHTHTTRTRARTHAHRRVRVRAAGLEEPGVKGAVGTRRKGATNEVAEADVDNTTAGGFFQYLGRDPNGPRPTVIPPAPAPTVIPPARRACTRHPRLSLRPSLSLEVTRTE